jgi:hypothetical protein
LKSNALLKDQESNRRYRKNKNLTPKDVVPGSHKKVWWICSKKMSHVWDEIIRNRNKSDGCPHCSGKRR